MDIVFLYLYITESECVTIVRHAALSIVGSINGLRIRYAEKERAHNRIISSL